MLSRVVLAALSMAVALAHAGCRVEGARTRAGDAAPSPQQSQPQKPPRPTGADAFERRTHTGARGASMRYLFFKPPEYDPRQKYPLVLWLHGGGSRGDDLGLILAHGDRHGPLFLARTDNQQRFPSFVLAPQLPADRFWSSPHSDRPTAEIALVLEIIDRLRAEYSVDDERVYVMGISLGGYATWDIITRRPALFAAAVPICGGGAEARARIMKDTAVWAFHGDRDGAVDVTQSRRMVAALRKAGGAPRYTEYAGVGHNSWERAFAEPDLLPWLFAQRKHATDERPRVDLHAEFP